MVRRGADGRAGSVRQLRAWSRSGAWSHPLKLDGSDEHTTTSEALGRLVLGFAAEERKVEVAPALVERGEEVAVDVARHRDVAMAVETDTRLAIDSGDRWRAVSMAKS